VVSNVTATPSSTGATISWTTNEPTTGNIDYGTTSGYGGSASLGAATTAHSVNLTGLSSGTTYHYRITATDAASNVATTDDATFVTTAPSGAGPAINVWYGTHQVFGTFGQTQAWVNVLGNVTDQDGVQSLTYALNGGTATVLTIGPDTRRLQSAGDFNADIAWSSLRVGDNTVLFRATDKLGNASAQSVTITLKSGATRNLPYTINWSTSTPLNEQAQLVDGLWTVDQKGLHIVQPGYDRLVDVGDLTLRDFVVTVPVTVYGFGPGANVYPSNEPLVGLGLRWPGHTAIDNKQPAWGWYPSGAFAWFRWYSPSKIEMRGNNDTPDSKVSASMTLGTKYIMKAQAKTQSNGSTVYSFRMWPASGTEPTTWNDQIAVDNGPATGSIILIAHQVDAAFGSVTVAAAP
jgi:hypothetical protein